VSTLRFTSLVSAIADPFCTALAHHLSARLAQPAEFVPGKTYGDREGLLDTQQVDLVWLCGLLYLHKLAAGQRLVPAVAPCMIGEEPPNQPWYYADIIVHAQSSYRTWAALRGATWAYNEEASFSGYQVVRAHLAQQQEFTPFFGKCIRSGAHLQSIDLVRRGVADCAAIDSTVLQMLRSIDPLLLREIRTIVRLGPYPMPLWVFTERCDPAMQQPSCNLLTQMHEEPAGRNLLAAWQIARFATVAAAEYEPLRIADEQAQLLTW